MWAVLVVVGFVLIPFVFSTRRPIFAFLLAVVVVVGLAAFGYSRRSHWSDRD